MNPDWSAEVTIEIPFHDVDMMEVAWHGHYVKYFEIARCALLDKINYNYPQMKASGFAWPVIELNVRYVQPAQFGASIRVLAEIVDYENRLKIRYTIFERATGRRLTKGHTCQVAVDMANGEMCFASPGVLYRCLGVASEE